METLIYGIYDFPSNKERIGKPICELTDNEFIIFAKKCGLCYSVKGFIDALNLDDIPEVFEKNVVWRNITQ